MPQANGHNGTSEHNAESVSLQNPQQMAAEMAKAFQELAKGEQTAFALEKKLDGIEGRIDELLAAAEASAKESEDASQGSDGHVDNNTSNNPQQ